jgi:membrane protein implicated in regulation of membrane protease activity
MSINLNDFFGLHLVLLWLALAVMLGALEWLRKDWTMAMLAAAAVLAALIALIVPHAWYVQLGVFVVASAIGEVVVRRRRLPAPTGDTPAENG